MEAKEQRGERMHLDRRGVLKSMAVVAVAGALPGARMAPAKPPTLAGSINPRWYGFNLMEFFSTDPDWMQHFPYKNDGIFQESDYKWIRDWGFNFVRLPMDYRFWTDPHDPMKIHEKAVEPIDRAVRLGEKYGVHVNICLHRAPGECCLDGVDVAASGIRITPEKTNVYTDRTTFDAFVHQWAFFAARYKSISSEKLSFNLVNEPCDVADGKEAADGKERYVRLVRAAIAGIRSNDAERLIVTDGYPWANSPIPELYDTGIMQSRHDYSPIELTHYRCAWARPRSMTWPLPTWPLKDAHGKLVAGKDTLAAEVRPWRDLSQQGIPIHFGETGCNRYTPPKIYYAWLSDMLDVINSLNSGWALWNFRGVAGPLDPDRPGTEYKHWYGHKLDFNMLRIIQSKLRA